MQSGEVWRGCTGAEVSAEQGWRGRESPGLEEGIRRKDDLAQAPPLSEPDFVLVPKTQHLCSFVLLITRGSQE